MVDFYGLGIGFPGTPAAPPLPIEKVRLIEQAVKEDICTEIPDLRPALRFIPYIQLHEFEGLLFSDPSAFAGAIGQPQHAAGWTRIRNQFATPEDINGSPDTAPSKRVLSVYPSYSKVLEGKKAAQAVGLDVMKRECPHFRGWVEQLAGLSLLP